LPSETIKGEYMSTVLFKLTIADDFKTQPVLKARLFGSFTRSEKTPENDVNILLCLKARCYPSLWKLQKKTKADL